MSGDVTAVKVYIAAIQYEDVRKIVTRVRKILVAAGPVLEEKVKYGMPMVAFDGGAYLYYAAWKNHLGIYPVPRFDPEFEKELTAYRAEKDTVKFVYKEPIPYQLIEQVATKLVAL